MAEPSFRGFVETTLDALLIFEGCKQGMLPQITRRLQEFEKRALVASGNVFVFNEESTGIKRWTDGLSWSPSRTLGNFLVYRELDKKGPGQASSTDDQAADTFDGTQGDASNLAAAPVASGSNARRRSLSDTSGVVPALDRARERALVGSLTSTYRFRADGLVKKTISLNGLHMIGYYKIDDVTSGRLRSPSSQPELTILTISSSFLTSSLFRVPPLVETGSDGQLHYKGEAEPPMSPLQRSGSSQGFNTPALGSSRSRPPSSDSTASASGQAVSPRLPPLSLSTSQRDPAVPGSPHRGSSSLRGSNRFDPYAGRASPSLSSNYSTAASGAGYPFPGGTQSPNRSSFSGSATGGDDNTFRNLDSAGSTPHSPSMLSSSAPSPNQHWAPQHPVGLSRANTGSDQSNTSAFYQPRHATPFPPAGESASSQGGSSAGGIFAFQPPPAPPARLQRPPGRASPPTYQYPFPPPALHPQQHLPSPPLGRPSSAQQYHAQAPLPSFASSSRPYTSQTFPLPVSGSYGSSNRPPAGPSRGDYQPPPLHQHQPTAYDYQGPSSYYSTSSYGDQRATGMVMGLSGELDPDESRHGLGLSEDRLEPLAADDARGGTIKEEEDLADERDPWNWRSSVIHPKQPPSWPSGGGAYP